MTGGVRVDTLSAGFVMESGDWLDDAACRDADPELFFSTDERDTRKAKAWCAACPVREPCLRLAFRFAAVGVWGGTTDGERDAWRRRSRRRR